MKSIWKRTISLLLFASLLLGMVPTALAKTETAVSSQAGAAVPVPGVTEPTPLTGKGIGLPADTEGTYLAFAANTEMDGTPAVLLDAGGTGHLFRHHLPGGRPQRHHDGGSAHPGWMPKGTN